MTVRVHRDTPDAASPLRPFVRRFLVVEFPETGWRDAHLPETGATLALSLRGGCRLGGGARSALAPRAAFTGLHETLRVHAHEAGHTVLIAAFTPVGAAALLRRPAQEEFAGSTTDLYALLDRPGALDDLRERLAAAADHPVRVRLLTAYLTDRLRDATPDPPVSAAVRWLRDNPGGRIDDLADAVGLSQSALERRFRRVVGLTPRRFASVARLRRAARLRAAGASLAAAARGAGYYDQAHFAREFRRATGSAPGAFLRGRGESPPDADSVQDGASSGR